MIAKNTQRSSSNFRTFLSASGVATLAACLLALPVLTACSGGDGSSGSGASGGSGGAGGAGGAGGGGGGMGGMGGGPPDDPCDFPHDSVVDVVDAVALKDALAKATPGQLIRLAPGTYGDTFDITEKGSPDKPIVLCGPREAILDATSKSSNMGVRLVQVDWWILSGFTVTGGRKGIYIDTSSDNVLSNLYVHDVGEAAIQLRNNAARNTIQYCEVQNTGLQDPTAAEGIYIGTPAQNWPNMMPDACDGTKILWNKFGPGIKTEHIDIKEGTQGGEIRGNTFDGTGITPDGSEDSWVYLTGNGYLFTENIGNNTPKDGYVVRSASGWGNDNVFEKNVLNVESPNIGINIGPGTMGNVVKCDNTLVGSGMLTNATCAN